MAQRSQDRDRILGFVIMLMEGDQPGAGLVEEVVQYTAQVPKNDIPHQLGIKAPAQVALDVLAVTGSLALDRIGRGQLDQLRLELPVMVGLGDRRARRG